MPIRTVLVRSLLAAVVGLTSAVFVHAIQDGVPLGFDYDVPPRRDRLAAPEYPDAARAKGIEGTVTLKMLIDAKGRVSEARVKTSIPELDAAAVACVKKWHFKPAQKAGRPTAAWAEGMVTFRLPKDKK